MSAHYHNGGGRYGILTLTIDDVHCLAAANTVHVTPVALPSEPLIAVGASAAATSKLHCQHAKRVQVFQCYHKVDKALVRTMIAATSNTYIKALSNGDYGYANVTALQLPQYLCFT
jgi:hypothetical protein